MSRIIVRIWSLPTTAVGLGVVALTLLTGGRAHLHTGVIEAHGGFARLLLTRLTLLPGGATAMTLGHVVIARTRQALDDTRAHERVHVRQCERWGPFFLPAYALCSAWIALRGGRAYRDNPFEREAFGDPSTASETNRPHK
ncbi:MAG TPA: hypothetical protein PLD59_12055 [Tepidisphaeraceae bacterium]|nr:hypothetical protein [Tepidisphaeraceae bacterium]